MKAATAVVSGPDAEQRLREMQLSDEALRTSLELAYIAASACTENEPRSAPGSTVWARAVGGLRDQVIPDGWTIDRAANYETTVSPDESRAVAVATGTKETGRTGGLPPRTKTPKGPATRRAVEHNSQLSFADVNPDEFEGAIKRDPSERETWLVLHHFDRDAKEIRRELSLPDAMEGSTITGWRERIILDPIPFDADIEIDYDDAGDDHVEVEVRRRAS